MTARAEAELDRKLPEPLVGGRAPEINRRDHGALLTCVRTVDDVLNDYATALRADFIGYRNHVYRVVNLCVAIAGRNELEKIAVAAVFHDLGIWTNRTFDYIAPSIGLAHDYLRAHARQDWSAEIEAMISDHHKITTSAADPKSLVEAFRRADWIDVTRGLRGFGVPRRFLAGVFATWPDAGFHWRLVTLTLDRFRRHPLTPLPMVKF